MPELGRSGISTPLLQSLSLQHYQIIPKISAGHERHHHHQQAMSISSEA